MKVDYFIAVENRAKALAHQYDLDLKQLEKERRNSRRGREHIDRKIVSRKQQLLDDLKGTATLASEILSSGVVDVVTTWWVADLPRKHDAQGIYRKIATSLKNENGNDAIALPDLLAFRWPSEWIPNWFGIEVSFTLKSPWYSKDDRPFHVLDNPVRKDRVFGTPFMSAASWKGLLRWACRMQAGLREHLEKHDMKMDGWKDPSWIIHLFGNEKGEEEHFRAGTLVFYPTWFSRVGFEVINPHSRSRRAGTQPIYYEVVPAGTTGRLQLLYAPLPGEIERDKVTPADFIDGFIDSIRALLETYGISAKRTAGWGTARIDTWTGMLKASAQPPKAETRPTKKTLHSLQDLGTLVREQIPAGSFTRKDAEEFKAEMKSRIARKGGDQ